MIEAHLYLDENTFIKTMYIPDGVFAIRICSPIGYIPVVLSREDALNDKVVLRVGVYELWQPLRLCDLNPYQWKYKFTRFEETFDHIPSSGSFDIGFVDPDKNVNLDKLKKKLRNNLDLKKRLLKFYTTT